MSIFPTPTPLTSKRFFVVQFWVYKTPPFPFFFFFLSNGPSKWEETAVASEKFYGKLPNFFFFFFFLNYYTTQPVTSSPIQRRTSRGTVFSALKEMIPWLPLPTQRTFSWQNLNFLLVLWCTIYYLGVNLVLEASWHLRPCSHERIFPRRIFLSRSSNALASMDWKCSNGRILPPMIRPCKL